MNAKKNRIDLTAAYNWAPLGINYWFLKGDRIYYLDAVKAQKHSRSWSLRVAYLGLTQLVTEADFKLGLKTLFYPIYNSRFRVLTCDGTRYEMPFKIEYEDGFAHVLYVKGSKVAEATLSGSFYCSDSAKFVDDRAEPIDLDDDGLFWETACTREMVNSLLDIFLEETKSGI